MNECAHCGHDEDEHGSTGDCFRPMGHKANGSLTYCPCVDFEPAERELDGFALSQAVDRRRGL